MDSVLASHPAALGSILGVPEGNLFPRCCRDELLAALLSTWTVRKLNNVDRTLLALLDSATKKPTEFCLIGPNRWVIFL